MDSGTGFLILMAVLLGAALLITAFFSFAAIVGHSRTSAGEVSYEQKEPVMAHHTPGAEIITYGGNTRFGDAAWKVVGPLVMPLFPKEKSPR